MATAKIKLAPFRIEIQSRFLIKLFTWNDPKVRAMALWPVIIYRHQNYRDIHIITNHELIHHRQQLEMLIIPFYIVYFTHYWTKRLKYWEHYKAYMSVVFEKEAYANEDKLDYLNSRKIWAWIKYL